ncbi:MAG: XRE family transcriptional regulator [Acidobacteria bacterium]|nr:MAG: XRE family transcriptional regulator [Acidobacteriota bacterium]
MPCTDPAAPLGRRLWECRQALGITQRESARLLGVDSSSVRDWESGKRQPIRIYRARILSFLVAGPIGFEDRKPDGSRPRSEP